MYTLFYRINYGVSIRIIYRDIIQCLLVDFNSVPERTPISCTAGFRKAKQSRIAPETPKSKVKSGKIREKVLEKYKFSCTIE